MADPFVAEIRIFAGNFAPTGWALCNGQLLPISQNTALFSLLGTTYGGDGKTSFALPNLQGRAPMHPGQGPALSNRSLGESGGAESVALLPSEMPPHTHGLSLAAVNAAATHPDPAGHLPAQTAEPGYCTTGTPVDMAPNLLASTGGSQPHNNLQPYLALNFIIALQGVFPPRS
jgi:microcystin-dependent protein